jgi:hypothetical protein
VEARKQGRRHARALAISVPATARATAAAAGAAAVAYFSLISTEFEGFRQFGIIGLVGMVLCWLSAFTVLPALLTQIARYLPDARPGPAAATDFAPHFASVVGRWARAIATLSAAAAAVAAYVTVTGYSSDLILADLTRMRSRHSEEHGSGAVAPHVNEIFQRHLTPTVVLARSRVQAREVAERLRDDVERTGPSALVAGVHVLDDFLPRRQGEKIAVLREIRGLLTPRLLRQVSASDRRLVDELLAPESLRRVRERDLLAVVLENFSERDGSRGRLVVVDPMLSDELRTREGLFGYVARIRRAADSVAPGLAVAGTFPTFADLFQSIERDGPKATAIAFGAVLTLLVLLFRRPRDVFWVASSLFVGVVWLAGLVVAFDLKINFLNFIALPITFGIGVDYAVNIYQRYRQEGRGSILHVLRTTGGAVWLCSLTTIIGYSSLLTAQNRAFYSFGLLAVLGEVTCLLAAALSLASWLRLRDRPRPPAGAVRVDEPVEDRRRAA